MNAYAPIRKVPLDYNGIASSAFAVQMEREIKDKETELLTNQWKEVGVVGNKYLLIPNTEVKDLADDIAEQSRLDWTPLKTFFDGRRYFYGMQCRTTTEEVKVGDDVGIGIGFWNSYDGSTALSFRLFLVRLACTNGMISKDTFQSFRFKHDSSSEGYEEEIMKAVDTIDNCSSNIDTAVNGLRKMVDTTFDIDEMKKVRTLIPALPVTTWGKITDNYLKKYHNDDVSLWEFYNSCTDILWHDKKPTVASFQHNAYITDALLGAMA